MKSAAAILALLAAMLFAVLMGAPRSAVGEGHGGMNEGGVVIAESAVIYSSPRGARPVAVLQRGEAVGAPIKRPGPDLFYFEEKYGRVRVVFFSAGKKPLHDYGWIEAAALTRFYYPRVCQPIGGPIMLRGARWEWAPCFIRARDAKLTELKREQQTIGP